MRTLTRLTSPGRVKGAGARHAREWPADIWLKASQLCSFLLLFIFPMSQCLIRV
jgi:hypothetical protein